MLELFEMKTKLFDDFLSTMFYHVSLLILFPCGFVLATFNPNCELSAESYMSNGIALQGETFWSTTTVDEIECAKHCVKRRICQSFNYDTEFKQCELNDGILTGDKTPETGRNLRYSEMSRWPSQIEPDCFDRPCEEDEVCIPGQFMGGATCSHVCLRLPFRCPLPEGIFTNQSRTVGSTLVFTCDRGYVGGDSARCLESGNWDKDINTTCTPVHDSACWEDSECIPIGGFCINTTCQCVQPFYYDAAVATCVKGCEADWLSFEDKCYYITTEEMPYPDARVYCWNLNSSLVQVETSAENDFLREGMRNITPAPNSGYWNDLFEMTTNGNEIWRTTGDPITFSGWHKDNPDDYMGKESCTIFWVEEDYQWVDIACDNTIRPDGVTYGYPLNRAVCERYP